MIPTITAALLSCVLQASSAVQIDPKILIAVMAVESGSNGIASHNRNATEDLGLMQINTGAWLDLVTRAHFNGDRRSAYLHLRDDACYNVQVGAWILQRAIKFEHGDIWSGVGRYHSNTPALKQRYQAKVRRAYHQLFGT